MKLDLLVVAAHPDDAEISVGGTILRLTQAGRQVGIVDMTRGEMGTRGTREDRDAETARANELMGVGYRTNLELPDGRVQATVESREALARVMRETRPSTVLAHTLEDRHPDHAATGRLAREAWFLSGLKRLAELDGGPPAARPTRLLHFLSHEAFEPTLVVDVGPVWEQKVEVVRCYASQLAPSHEGDQGAHFLYGADILRRMETKARTFGERIGALYGEPLLSMEPMACADPDSWLV
jgi:bacillithiol biosynthesis deacetylase BshB1